MWICTAAEIEFKMSYLIEQEFRLRHLKALLRLILTITSPMRPSLLCGSQILYRQGVLVAVHRPQVISSARESSASGAALYWSRIALSLHFACFGLLSLSARLLWWALGPDDFF